MMKPFKLVDKAHFKSWHRRFELLNVITSYELQEITAEYAAFLLKRIQKTGTYHERT